MQGSGESLSAIIHFALGFAAVARECLIADQFYTFTYSRTCVEATLREESPRVGKAGRG